MPDRKPIVFVTTADTDILTADRALTSLPEDFPAIRAFNSESVESSQDQDGLLEAVEQCGVVVLRLLGGKRALSQAFDPLVRLCHARGIPLIACPGHQEWDEDLVAACSVPVAEVETVFSYLMRGGIANMQNLFLFLSDSYLGSDYGHDAPTPLPWEGLYHPDVSDGADVETFVRERFQDGRPSIGVLFYRAHWMSGTLQAIDSLIRRLESLEVNVLPVFSYSLKHEPESNGPPESNRPFNSDEGGAAGDQSSSTGGNRTFSHYLVGPDGSPRVDCIINTMGMSMSNLSQEGATFASGWSVDYLDRLSLPIIQGISSTGTEEQWLESSLGLGPIDTAMNVALPEFDGRIISVPFSFKEESAGPEQTRLGTRLQRYVAREDRVDFLARLAVRWAKLGLKPNREKRIAIILSNYPTKDARIGNAVGLDTPASVIRILHALQDAGYIVTDMPDDGDALVQRLI